MLELSLGSKPRLRGKSIGVRCLSVLGCSICAIITVRCIVLGFTGTRILVCCIFIWIIVRCLSFWDI